MEHQASGKIFIEAANYRIHKLQYSTIELQSHQQVPLYNVSVEYVNRGDLMYLNYISFNNEFKMVNQDDFRVLEVRQLKDTVGFLVRFSHQPSFNTALEPSNYDFRLNGKQIALQKVIFTQNNYGKPHYRMEVVALVKNTSEFNEQLRSRSQKTISADFKGIRDLKDRKINVMTYLNATQYREIFVQQHLTNQSDSTNYPVIDKYAPLYNIPQSKESATHSNFWMNTPLKKTLESSTEY